MGLDDGLFLAGIVLAAVGAWYLAGPAGVAVLVGCVGMAFGVLRQLLRG